MILIGRGKSLFNTYNCVLSSSSFQRINTYHNNNNSNNGKIRHYTTINTNPDVLQEPVMPTTCCGNGCNNCVWDDYFRELEEYNMKVKSKDPNAPEEPLLTSNENEDPMQFFMKMERYQALQKKKQQEQQEQQQQQQQQQKEDQKG